ncbi:MAG: insulinase family protein [Candidatus Hydrogenedentes bacterium]|nr:insulinase family protein [Candidatus Hydrogenedentota bacterium]
MTAKLESIAETAMVSKLPNGMTIALERLPYLRSASAGVWVRSGSGNETPRQSGLAHFLEHLFFKGTATRTTHELMSAVESRGGHLNAFTSREYTCLYVKMLDQDIHVGIEILADLIKNSLFSDLEKEKNVILEEIASIEDTPEDYVHDLLSQHHWPDHPMGRPISGTIESVSQLALDDVRAFYQDWYTPEEMFFVIAGNFDEERVLAQVQGEFGTLPARRAPQRHQPPVFRAGINPIARDIAQAHVCLAFPAPTVLEEERYTCELVSSILGGGSTSWLFERIREDEGLAYSIYTFNAFHASAGMLGVYAAIAPENLARAMELVYESLRRLRDDGISPEELEMNRQQLKGNMLMALESTSTRMSRMAKSLIYHDRIVSIDEIIQRLDAVTETDVQAHAQKAFKPQTTTVTVLGPVNGHVADRVLL